MAFLYKISHLYFAFSIFYIERVINLVRKSFENLGSITKQKCNENRKFFCYSVSHHFQNKGQETKLPSNVYLDLKSAVPL